MTPTQVKSRLELLKTRLWPKAELESWLGINFAQANPLLAQFQMWDTGSYEAAYIDPPAIDRGRFAMFLGSRNYVPLRGAAVSLALTDRSFLEVMSAERTQRLFPVAETQGAFPHVYHSDFISGFFKFFPPMRKSVFPSNEVFFKLLHDQIREHLQVQPEPLMCLTSRVLGESHYADSLDAITEQPVSLPYQVFLDTSKPIQLRPDSCSWLTYFQFEDILRPALLGRQPDCTPEQVELLRSFECGN